MNNYRSNIILVFLKPDEKGEDKAVRVSLNNVRTDLTAEEVKQVALTFESLTAHGLSAIEFVQFSHIY